MEIRDPWRERERRVKIRWTTGIASTPEIEREVEVGDETATVGRRALAPLRVVRDGDRPASIEIGGEAVAVRVAIDGERVFVWCRGRAFEFSERPQASSPAGRRGEISGGLRSPMPGRVRKVLVAPGDQVSKGQVLLVLEAMKMEHAIRSPHEGRVTKVAFAEGDLVEAGAELAEVAATEG